MSAFSRRYTWVEVTEVTGLPRDALESFIAREWLKPAGESELDDEDVARIRLIQELKDDFGANDESIPLILHLMDQLYCLRGRLERLKGRELTRGRA
jgi:chaperone modulatory protein CbpM